MERFRALCEEAWELGRLDISGTVLVTPDQREEIRRAHQSVPYIHWVSGTEEEHRAYERKILDGGLICNPVTGSEVEVRVLDLSKLTGDKF